MAKIFRIDMLPAREGDCLWIEYGEEERPQRILIDGGRQSAYEFVKARFADLPDDQRELELALLTHVDADHIEGFLKLLDDTERGVTFKDLWFNAFHHLDKENFVALGADDDAESFGGVQGETLTKGLVDQKWPWNAAFDRGPVVVPDQDAGDLPVINLAGGMKLTILSPTWKGLKRMRSTWKKEVEKAGLVPGAHIPEEAEEEDGQESFGTLDANEINELAELSFKKDSSAANASSSAVLAEYGGKRLLLTGDAHANVLEETLQRLPGLGQGDLLDIDVFKISHHGSRGTLSTGLVQIVNGRTYLVSTDGSRHHHPDREAIARIVRFGPDGKTLVFNYRTEENQVWDQEKLKEKFSYSTRYPEIAGSGEIQVNLL